MPLYERDGEGKLVPLAGDVPEEVYRAIERYDDEAIVQRLTTGLASQEFIYSYPIKTAQGTKEIIGISSDGASEIALMLGNLEVLPDFRVDKDSDPDYYYASIRARDITRNVTLLGVGRQCKFQIGKGNLPDRERMDEHAFVKSITKAQRNVILHLAPEEIIIKIIDTWSKRGKGKQLVPPKLETETAPSPSPTTVATQAATPQATPVAPTAEQVTEQVERLKELRMQVHNKFQTDLGIGLEKRRSMLAEKFQVNSLTELSEQQLKECLSWVEEMITQKTVSPLTKPPTAVAPEFSLAETLGFEDGAEQNKLRGTLYTALTAPNQLDLKDEEAKKFISDRGYSTSTEIHKTRLLEILKEVDGLIKVKQAPTEF